MVQHAAAGTSANDEDIIVDRYRPRKWSEENPASYKNSGDIDRTGLQELHYLCFLTYDGLCGHVFSASSASLF